MKYNYEKDPCRCPKCQGLGMPWMAYFTCEDCGAVYFIETGEEVQVSSNGKVSTRDPEEVRMDAQDYDQ